MLLSLAPIGQIIQIKAIWTEEETKTVLEDAGIVTDSKIQILFKPSDTVFVIGINRRRIMIDDFIARKIIVQ